MTRVHPLTSATCANLPGCCVDCMFWQDVHGVSDAHRKRRWAHGVEDHFGPWGRLVDEGPRLRGMIQYGPSTAFPRADVLPAGPPHHAAALVTCAFLDGDDRPGTCERLMLEALADVKARGFPAVEAFALHRPDEVALLDRFHAHQTLFDRTFLQRLGFQMVRARGPVSLMRLDLGGLIAGEEPGVLARVLARVRADAAAVRPEPA